VEVLLGDINNWQFDSFKLADAANGRPLSLLTFHLLQRMQLTKRVSNCRDGWGWRAFLCTELGPESDKYLRTVRVWKGFALGIR
jgi:hypothetical protein